MVEGRRKKSRFGGKSESSELGSLRGRRLMGFLVWIFLK